MDISEEDYQKAVAVVRKCLSGSVSNLQRKLYWGYGRAASAIDRMQDEFIVSPMSTSGRRDVYPEETHQLWKELQEAKAQAVPERTNQTFEDWLSDPENTKVYFGGYRERANEFAHQAWMASLKAKLPKDKILMPRSLDQKHIDYVVHQLAISSGASLISEVYGCLIESQEPAQAKAVPEGFVLVPKEPTYEMLEAGSEARSRTEGHIASIWEAMIEAQEQAND